MHVLGVWPYPAEAHIERVAHEFVSLRATVHANIYGHAFRVLSGAFGLACLYWMILASVSRHYDKRKAAPMAQLI